MSDSVHREREQLQVIDGEPKLEEPQGTGNTICSHDGVLLKKASAEFIADLNTSGSLSIVEYGTPPSLYIEWRKNDSIPIMKDNLDQDDWSLVDTITRRTRTASECRAFNIKLSPNSAAKKPRVLRTKLEELATIEIYNRGQGLRILGKHTNNVHSEFIIQYGNANIFVTAMRQLHLIDSKPSIRNGEEYAILSPQSQKLKRTFAELDIGDVKASSDGESWLSNKLAGFVLGLPEIINPRGTQRSRPGALYDDSVGDLNISYSGSSLRSSSDEMLQRSPGDTKKENVEKNDEKLITNTLPEREPVVRGAPLNEAQWLQFRTSNGRIPDRIRVKEIILRGGINHNLRSTVWKYLLNYYQWDESDDEQQERCRLKSQEYYSMKLQWESITPAQERNCAAYRERKNQIEKDVRRTDRCEDFFAGDNNSNLQMLHRILMTYAMYNFDLGYVQGMSDLLAPILMILVDDEREGKDMRQKEADAFWCFVGFMDMVFANFEIDQTCIQRQFKQLIRLIEFTNPRLFTFLVKIGADNMFFCFRWLLVWFKREFSINDVVKLWECLWTRLPCPNFHLFFAAAILEHNTEHITETIREYSGIVLHTNGLTGRIDVTKTLCTAEAIYLQIKATDNLPNDIREIIGEPLFDIAAEIDDGFHQLDRMRLQERLEDPFELAMSMNT